MHGRKNIKKNEKLVFVNENEFRGAIKIGLILFWCQYLCCRLQNNIVF